jgi:hypothetical protein
MILLEIDPERVAFVEFERDAPGSIDVNGVARRLSPQGVEVKSRNVHILGEPSAVESVEPAKTTFVQGTLDMPGRARLKQFFQALVPEAPDHAHM